MPRLEVELTSTRPDGSWTWRKAGARQPKGEVAGNLVPSSSKVGDVLRVEADVLIDGIEITEVLPAKGERVDKFERVELKGRPVSDDQLVSSTLVSKGKGDREGRGRGRGDRPDRPRREGGGGDRGRGGRDAPRGERSDRPRGPQ